MGGGDLNMKKSWHPLLLKNQERVWLEEKKALEEKKKLDQLRKEKEEERQLQELQRLQEEQTGKKRTEKLEWMYATPATGSSSNANDLEDYLLGKKRVDKILTADDNAKVGASHKNFIAIQNANNARDVAAKIREDPLFAIKQQEQAALQAVMNNPLRLRALQEQAGIKPKKDKKKEKEERKRLKHEEKERRRRKRHSDSRSPERHRSHRSRSRSPRPSRRDDDSPRRYRDDLSHRRSRSPVRDDSRRHSYPSRLPRSYDKASDQSSSPDPPTNGDRGKRPRSRSRSPRRDDAYSKRSRADYSPPRTTHERPSNDTRPSQPAANDRAARLAAMQSNASSMTVDRRERLALLLQKEKAELEEDERARRESKGMSSYLNYEQKRVFGGKGGLEDRIRRGRGGMVVDAD
ncbi:hypothetical protein FA15DRAFT_684059 [Coprinopsis marcescibilis]|uniref:CBF1-interacting co-repressor CIR N-terminal domain-containing protein n=1 Tax=Coprinopsis marcescibilis TaxID=230819 RepID=A0A5C3LDM4_COPMA|nr:hypothetical protein FA15DRAFT_684059 [Coprinopsis marcescibilis]